MTKFDWKPIPIDFKKNASANDHCCSAKAYNCTCLLFLFHLVAFLTNLLDTLIRI